MKHIEIERALKGYLPKGNDALSRAMRYSVFSGGKRIRPILTIESSKACGGKLSAALPAACAVELVHTYSLIHDDLPAMDNDDFRRGKPTCHKVFGQANAILAGDALLTLAFNILSEYSDTATGMKIVKELSDAVGVDGMVRGQALDLEFQRKRRDGKIARKIDLLKTAKLFAAAAKIGALTAQAGPRKMKALERFGGYLGLSFQIVDDHLDGEGDKLKESSLLIEKANKELLILKDRAKNLKELALKLSVRKI